MSRRNDAKPVVKQQVVRSVVGVEDMVLLPDIKDSGIVANLKLRLQSELIYTSIGHVLVACNPYKWLPIYSEAVMKRYTLQQRVDVPPHIFATAEAAYRNMIQEEDNQCVIISGESGAGKTEASKQIQAYIAKVSGGGPKVEQTKKVFLESNPVLEAFGNAKTLRNNNSSRFGKYFELKFDRFGAPIGGLVTNYLLEKSRIVNPGRGERNFHIFYQLLNSQLAESLGVKEAVTSFAYLSAGGGKAAKVEGVDDAAEMEVTLNAMKSVGMKNGQIKSILSLVGAILHLGNIEFESIQMEGVEGCRVITKASTPSGIALRKACELLGVDAKAFVRCLTVRELTTMAPGGRTEEYQIPQHSAQAAARRDAIAKAIYEHLFDLIVERINVALDPSRAEEAVNHTMDLEVDVLSIGVLDIYGFEVFEHNSFEQLCINYVNEKLQQIFIELTLNAEQIEYESEGIAWTPIPFFNNKIVCDLLDGARPSGLFRVLDDTCKTMHGTKAGLEVDKKFLDSARQLHGNNAHFRSATNAFVVKHYAGDVTYDAGKLGESNKDALDNDLLGILKSSTDKLLIHLFKHLEVQEGGKGGSVLPSAGTRIRQQCQLLVTALMECTPHYVRCVKSNDAKAALTMDGPRVQHQAKYLGLAENIKVRRAGFAYRNDFHRFLDRFGILSPATYPEWRGTDLNGCKEILRAIQRMPLPAGLNLKNEVQLGMTKLFIRTPEMYFAIEQLRDKAFERYAEVIQRAYRKYRNTRELVSLQNAMHALYEGQQKTRRRESIYCPFSGDSLNQLNAAFLGSGATASARRTPAQESEFKTLFKDSMYRIIDYYNPKEVVLFVDPHAAQVVKSVHHHGSSSSTSSGVSGVVNNLLPAQVTGCSVLGRVIVLTDKALYIMEKLTPEGWRNMQHHANVPPAEAAQKRPPGMLLLRRRVPLPNLGKGNNHNQTGVLNGVVLSQHADCCILLQIAPPASSLLPAAQVLAGLKKTWAKDDSSRKCTVSGEPFSLFNRRHHCRVSGKLVCNGASMHMQLLPDVQLHTPQRVGDHVLGLVSCDPLEDTVLLTTRKTEFAALVATQCLCPAATQRITPALLGSVISFQNTFKLRPNSYVPGNISLMPGIEVQIRAVSAPASKATPTGTPTKGGKSGKKATPTPASGVAASMVVLEGFAAALESGGKLVVSCAADGITHQAVLERRERQLQRQKRAAKRRRREEKERLERRAVRDAEREQQRLQRLAERKVKKLAEKHARRRRAELASGLSQSTKGIKSSNSLTRLAAETEPTRSGRRSPGVTASHRISAEPSAAPQQTYQTPTKAPRASRMSEAALPRDSEASFVTAVGDELPIPVPVPVSAYKPRHGGVPLAMGGTGAGAGEELQAAMARRRAKNNQE